MSLRLLSLTYLFLITSFTAVFTSPDNDWKLRKSENGITVFTRHQAGFSIYELKTETDVQAPLSTVAAVIKDADHYKDWIYHCTKSRVVKKVSDFEQYEYQVNSLPYPFSDRDIVVHFTMKQDSVTKIVTTHSLSVPGYVPEVKGMVRIPVFDGSYSLIPKPDGSVHIVYTLQIEPGGALPDWLVNLNIVEGPYESIFNLKNRVLQAINNRVSDPNIKD